MDPLHALGLIMMVAVVAYQWGWNRGYDEAEERWSSYLKRSETR